jgi:hypothetical protein
MKLPQLYYIAFLVAATSAGCDQSVQTASTATSPTMNEQYTPPEMPPFPTDYDGVMTALAPYYKEQRPLDFFFEMYIVDVIDQLPEDTLSALSDFSNKHPTFFETHNGDWRQYVIEESHLSDTIEVAIWDLWIRNSKNATDNGWEYHPWHYAENFSTNFFAEGSRVDVWEGDSLEQARKRVESHRKNAR